MRTQNFIAAPAEEIIINICKLCNKDAFEDLDDIDPTILLCWGDVKKNSVFMVNGEKYQLPKGPLCLRCRKTRFKGFYHKHSSDTIAATPTLREAFLSRRAELIDTTLAENATYEGGTLPDR